jgi:hypothetical protein
MSTRKNWYGGRAPWELDKLDFLKLHNTGYITSDTYLNYERDGGLSWLGKISEYPIFDREENGIEYRRTGNKLSYSAVDMDGKIRRDEEGMAIHMTDEEISKKDYPKYDQTIVAFSNKEPIGFVSNEFGAVGVWVEGRYQKQGIGLSLLKNFIDENPSMRIGKMTNAGVNAVLKLHDVYVQDHFDLELNKNRTKRIRP